MAVALKLDKSCLTQEPGDDNVYQLNFSFSGKLSLYLIFRISFHRQFECGSVVSRFYQGFVNSAFLGKIKKKVASAVEYHESCLIKEPEDEEDTPDPQVRVI